MITLRLLEDMKSHGAKEFLFDDPNCPTNYGIEKRMYDEFVRCCKIFNLRPEIDVEIESGASTNSKHAVGTASSRTYETSYITIDFNFIKKHLKGLESVVAHEMAHIAASLEDRFCKAHGRTWARKMSMVGYPADRLFNCNKYKN